MDAISPSPKATAGGNHHHTPLVFARIEQILLGAKQPRLQELGRQLGAECRSLCAELERQEAIIAKRKALIKSLIADSRKYGPIPESEITPQQLQVFTRVSHITGIMIVSKDRTMKLYEVCLGFLEEREEYRVRDKTTMLLSEHTLTELLSQTIADRRRSWQARKHPGPVTLVACDLNGFGEYNKKLLWEKTNEVLHHIGQLIRHSANMYVPGYRELWKRHLPDPENMTPQQIGAAIREIKRSIPPEICERTIPVFRLHGDEFCLIMPCGKAEAERRMAKINDLLVRRHIRVSNPQPTDDYIGVKGASMSYGCYELDSTVLNGKKIADGTVKEVLERAENEMQQFKDKFKSPDADGKLFRGTIPLKPIFTENRLVITRDVGIHDDEILEILSEPSHMTPPSGIGIDVLPEFVSGSEFDVVDDSVFIPTRAGGGPVRR